MYRYLQYVLDLESYVQSFIRTSVQIRMYSVHMYCSIARTVFSVSASADRCVYLTSHCHGICIECESFIQEPQ